MYNGNLALSSARFRKERQAKGAQKILLALYWCSDKCTFLDKNAKKNCTEADFVHVPKEMRTQRIEGREGTPEERYSHTEGPKVDAVGILLRYF